MKMEERKNEGFNVCLTVTRDGEDWRASLVKASKELQKRHPVPGFRAGKAPLETAGKVYGKSLTELAAKDAMGRCFERACAERGYAPVSTPEFQVISSDLGELRFSCSFTDYPQVGHIDCGSIQVEKPVKCCTEKDIDDEIARYMFQHLRVRKVDREARMGDIVEVDCTGTRNGAPVKRSSRFQMGSGQMYAGLDDALLGAKAGAELTVTLTMPENFHRKDDAGVTFVLTAVLRGVWVRELLECTDEYVRENVPDCKTLAEFREKLRGEIQKRYDAVSMRLFEKHLDRALAGTVPFDVPAAMAESALEEFMDTLRAVAAQRGMTGAQMLALEGKTVTDFREESRPLAEQQVKISLALECVAREEGLTVTAEEADRHFAEAASIAGISIAEAERREGGREEYLEKLLNDKAARRFRELVRTVEVPVDEFPSE